MIEMQRYKLRKRACSTCGVFKADLDFHWYAYTTRQGKRSRRRDPDCRVCVSVAGKKRRPPGSTAGQSKVWRNTNRIEFLTGLRRYRSSEHGRRQRAKAQAARGARAKAGIVGPEDPRILALYQEAKDLEEKLAACVVCDDPLEMEMHVDHVIPFAKGGKHVLENLQILSARRNLAKGISLNGR